MKSFNFKSLLSIVLLVTMLLGLVGCTPSFQPPAENTIGNPNVTKKPETTSDPADETDPRFNEALRGTGRLIYYENFDKTPTSDDTTKVLYNLGWKKDTVEKGSYSESTADLSIEKYGGNKMLLIENDKKSAADSYFIILSAALMGKFHETNYTYQYDVIYKSSGDTRRYIALVSEYNGLFYNSFHFRNVGTANNQCHTNSEWVTYDVEGENYAANTNQNSIVTKLLGKSYSESVSSFEDISVSIRYVVDWTNGNSIYMRVNTKGYPGTDKWVLVSKGTVNGSFTPSAGGGALALKVGGAQDGYVDNIMVWEGTDAEPEDKSEPLLDAKTKGCSGHLFTGTGKCNSPFICEYCEEPGEQNAGHSFEKLANADDSICTVCSCYKSSADAGWGLDIIPPYTGGKQSSDIYLAGHGVYERNLALADESKMILVSGTNASEFKAYVDLLSSYGFKKVYEAESDGNLYAQFEFHDDYIYAYYTSSVKEVRIILDKQSECSPQDFGYTYDKKIGDATILYQYGVPMNSEGVNINNNDEGKIDCGMMYVMKLADNSIFIVDGGGIQQFDENQIDGFMRFLRQVTGAGTSDKIKISGWYMTHGHPDHMAGFCLFVKKYSQYLDFDRIFFNFPSSNSPTSILRSCRSTHVKMMSYVDKYIKDDGVQYIKIHTGQSITLADIKIDVLFTHEDIVSATSASSYVANDYNNSCAVLMIHMDGKKFLLLGDINKPSMDIILKNNSNATLKCDIVQLAHHVINDLSKLYNISKASVVLVPQSPKGAILNQTRRNGFEAAKKYIDPGMLFYASEQTTGLQVIAGKVVQVFTDRVYGGKYTGWGW